MLTSRAHKYIGSGVFALILVFSLLGWLESRKNFRAYPEWLRVTLRVPQASERLNAVPAMITPMGSTGVNSPSIDLDFFRLICKPENVSVVNRSAGQKTSVAVDFQAYGVCVVKTNQDAGKYQDQLHYEWQKSSLMRTGSELNRFGVWKKAGEKYLSQINAKRFRCLLGSEILLYEGDNLNAIVAFTGPGKSRKPLYSLFEYGGRFSETCFLSNAVLYDKSGKPQLSTAFYFDESLTSEEAKRLIADFLSAIRI